MNNLRVNDFKMFQNGIFFFLLCYVKTNKQTNKQHLEYSVVRTTVQCLHSPPLKVCTSVQSKDDWRVVQEKGKKNAEKKNCIGTTNRNNEYGANAWCLRWFFPPITFIFSFSRVIRSWDVWVMVVKWIVRLYLTLSIYSKVLVHFHSCTAD